MHSVKRRAILYLGFVVFLALATVGTTTNTFAANGTLTETAPANVSATQVALNGTNRTTTYTLPITVSDSRSGQAQGWNLTITSTTFTAGTHTLSTSASTISTVSCSPTTCANLSNSISYSPPLAVPAGSPAPNPPTKFFNASGNTSKADFTITPTVTIAIPANTFAGTYTSTLTIAIVSGP